MFKNGKPLSLKEESSMDLERHWFECGFVRERFRIWEWGVWTRGRDGSRFSVGFSVGFRVREEREASHLRLLVTLRRETG